MIRPPGAWRGAGSAVAGCPRVLSAGAPPRGWAAHLCQDLAGKGKRLRHDP